MPDGSFVAVAVVAFTAPLLRELVPALLVPAVVLELMGGILIGPHVLGIAESTEAVQLFSTIGLAALLFLAGREIDVERLRGALLRRAAGSFIVAFVIGSAIGGILYALELVEAPLLIAVILVATSLSVIIVPLRDAGETETRFGQAVIATAAFAEFGAVILLSFLFSTERGGFETEIVHLAAFGLAASWSFSSSRTARGSSACGRRWSACRRGARRSGSAATSLCSRSWSGWPSSSASSRSSPPSRWG